MQSDTSLHTKLRNYVPITFSNALYINSIFNSTMNFENTEWPRYISFRKSSIRCYITGKLIWMERDLFHKKQFHGPRYLDFSSFRGKTCAKLSVRELLRDPSTGGNELHPNRQLINLSNWSGIKHHFTQCRVNTGYQVLTISGRYYVLSSICVLILAMLEILQVQSDRTM